MPRRYMPPTPASVHPEVMKHCSLEPNMGAIYSRSRSSKAWHLYKAPWELSLPFVLPCSELSTVRTVSLAVFVSDVVVVFLSPKGYSIEGIASSGHPDLPNVFTTSTRTLPRLTGLRKDSDSCLQ